MKHKTTADEIDVEIKAGESEKLPDFVSPTTKYFKEKSEFDEAVGLDFIRYANEVTRKEGIFLVGLSHGQSPAGPYQFILDNYNKLSRPELIRYTFVNSRLKRQRGLVGVMDAVAFLKTLLHSGRITKDQVIGRRFNRDNMDEYCREMNERLAVYLEKHNKKGLDYIFVATDPVGCVAGISRHSAAFNSKDIVCVVNDRTEQELTLTPDFIKKTPRIAFLATKADKRRALAWLFYEWGRPDESPSFLRFVENVKKRMTVFIDDKALTWPQVEVKRRTSYGSSSIHVDLAHPYDENAKKKLPVVVLVHGFLGLNSFDGLLTAIPSSKYIAAAMHYGSVPNELPIADYSKHIVKNIDAVVAHFGKKGHPVYIFDHSMGNIYFLMMEKLFDELKGIKTYLRGRIGANPFFGEESKHAILGFLDSVILHSGLGPTELAMFYGVRRIIPLDSKVGVRNRGISLTEWLIRKDSSIRDSVWKAVKKRILFLMTNMGSLPDLNRIPIERALSRLPAKIFVIQTHSGLIESKAFDRQVGLPNMEKHGIPVLILKSERDGVAKFVPRIYKGHTQVIDITNEKEKDLFREHLFHIVHPRTTTMVIDEFIMKYEASRKRKKMSRPVPEAI